MHKIGFEVDEQTYTDFINLIPWGSRQRILEIMAKDLLKAVKNHPGKVIAGLLTRTLGTENIVKELKYGSSENAWTGIHDENSRGTNNCHT